ncbi:metal-dependent transcriptional regulator [Bariatricus sp. SGI.154]|uniref:metal-dependent transcriptional regulator n=1 Tax=Bariatricus sp. SGI.154 TaxID=3420549 RepID=UPI003D039620
MSYTKHKSEESVEDYLEAILVLSNRIPEVRSIDIANHLNYSKPSISVAMKNLKNRDYITVGDTGHIHLTAEGRRIAESVYERHTLISDWLIRLGVNPETAVNDACKMEHDISPESFEAIKNYIQNN